MNAIKNFSQYRAQILLKSLKEFVAARSAIIKVGIELEFYLLYPDFSPVTDAQLTDDFASALFNSSNAIKSSLIYKIEREQGVGQLEIKLLPHHNLPLLCQQIEEIKIIASNLAKSMNLIASFAAQVFDDDCGSAMQFNISWHDSSNKNLFDNDEKLLIDVIGSLLETINESLILMAPEQQDFLRFDNEFNKNLYKKGRYTAPTNISFGFNNRSAAIRIPAIGNRRIEYRLAAANADTYLSLAAILIELTDQKNSLEIEKYQIYGNAFDAQYNLPSFIKNYDEALLYFNSSDNLIRKKFLQFIS